MGEDSMIFSLEHKIGMKPEFGQKSVTASDGGYYKERDVKTD